MHRFFHPRRCLHPAAPTAVALVAVLCLATPSRAETTPADPAAAPLASAKRAGGKGAGLRFGNWEPRELNQPGNTESSESPALEGWFEKELDARLVLENTIGVWRRSQSTEQADLFGTTREESESYVVPMISALRFYPVKRDRRLAPYVGAGIGVALGVDKHEVSGNGPPPLNPDEGTNLITGFAYKAGTGLDWYSGKAFGLTVGARYQWIRFDQEVGGDRYYKGVVIDAGVVYRFQPN